MRANAIAHQDPPVLPDKITNPVLVPQIRGIIRSYAAQVCEMNVELLDYFSEWFAANGDLLNTCNATVSLSNPAGTEKPGLYADVDFDGGELVGRITLWATGECDLEALCPSTGNYIFGENHIFESAGSLDAGLRRFFKSLKRQ
jgi:hypothetical protein